MELGIIGLGRMGANMTERLVLGFTPTDHGAVLAVRGLDA